MAIKQAQIYECDICERQCTSTGPNKTWLVFDIEDSFEDTKCLCPSCLDRISKAMKQLPPAGGEPLRAVPAAPPFKASPYTTKA